MPIEYKRLTENELDIFIEMRINQLREEGAKEDIDLKPALKDYYSRHMTEGTFVSWIAVDGNKIIGTAINYIQNAPVSVSSPSDAAKMPWIPKFLESVFCKLPAYAAYCSAEAAVNAGAAQMKILKHC